VIRFENLTEMLSTTLNYKKFSARFIITAAYMALLCTVFDIVHNNNSIILHYNKRSIISTDIIKCQNFREQVRYFVHITQC